MKLRSKNHPKARKNATPITKPQTVIPSSTDEGLIQGHDSTHTSSQSAKRGTSPSFPKQSSTRLVGYARVSTEDQNVRLQTDALKRTGVSPELIFCDKVSGSTTERLGLQECLDTLRPGDILVVWKLDRLGRSLRHLLDVVASLQEKQIGFRSLQESIDTTTSGGKLVFHVFAALAEFERDLIRERTLAGLKAARARGRRGGRPPLASSDHRVQSARAVLADPNISISQYCSELGIHRSTLYRRAKMASANDADPTLENSPPSA